MTARDGNPCIRCGTSEWNLWCSCKECARRRTRKWSGDNPERKRERDAQWQRDNPDKVAQRNKKWKDAHPEQHRLIMKESGQKWAESNPDKKLEATRRWKRSNPERVAILENNRRARKQNSGGTIAEREWQGLLVRYGNKCLCCGRDDVKLTVDHVIPLSEGGPNTIDNIQPLCQSCNSRKRTKTVDYRT